MPELTPEALAARIAAQTGKPHAAPGVIPATVDWRSVVGMFEDSETMRLVDAEVEVLRATEEPTADEEVAR